MRVKVKNIFNWSFFVEDFSQTKVFSICGITSTYLNRKWLTYHAVCEDDGDLEAARELGRLQHPLVRPDHLYTLYPGQSGMNDRINPGRDGYANREAPGGLYRGAYQHGRGNRRAQYHHGARRAPYWRPAPHHIFV